jgi:bifunctional non-homologous end joining protein LigD
MSLETYRRKRDFGSTPEPRGRQPRGKGQRFVIQKHAAQRLHYDFRIELGGVLKSWAVTRGPSLVAGERRLAVRVEDHPLDYATFEGTIPKGAYGGGSVIVWDQGSWAPLGDPEKALVKGHLEFTLQGEKLKGRWHLVRMQGKKGESRENWLLIKGDDGFARAPGAPDILEERPESVRTGRQIEAVAADDPDGAATEGTRTRRRAASGPKAKAAPEDETAENAGPFAPTALTGARKSRMPDFVAPMLATLARSAPTGDDWLHEIKFDGYRIQARIAEGRVRLLTRGGLDWTDRFGPDLVAALAQLPPDRAIFDGELVVETAAGASDFAALQGDLTEGRTDRFVFYAFDVMYLDGYDLRPAPLVERKAVLEGILAEAGRPLRYSQHFPESGAMVLRHACRLSLEGIVSKRADDPYRSGRGRSWIKSKCLERQEFVIGGFVPSAKRSGAVGSLVLGVHDAKGLLPVGRVGTGFTAATAADLFRKLGRLAGETSPFATPLSREQAEGVRFVRPDLVAEVEFGSWTADRQLRHAAFRGLREDKPAAEVIREGTGQPGRVRDQRRRVRLTHPDRVYWPGDGVTKADLADHYERVWRRIAPFVAGRPLALLRCPKGLAGPSFFQKHVWKGMPAKVVPLPDPQGTEPLVGITDLDGLIGLVQSATLEIHPWGALAEDLDRPDMIVMDLDPGEGVAWERVIEAAGEVRQRLSQAGLAAFVKTSGGKGLHVVAPLVPYATWPEVKTFTRAMAEAMARDMPDRYVATISKAKRKGRILIDYLRNQRGATAVAAYSTRARPRAPVSTPVGWEELGPGLGPASFTVINLPERLDALTRDPWEGFQEAAAPLERKGRR